MEFLALFSPLFIEMRMNSSKPGVQLSRGSAVAIEERASVDMELSWIPHH
jgi:hypothetical protein